MNVEAKTPEHHPLHVTISASSLGLVLVARSERGLRAVLLGDDRDLLLADLRRRFPGTTLIEEEMTVNPLAARVIAHVESPSRDLDLPLDLDGTEFQRIVWQALREIPAGSTVTYTGLANRIGKPEAVRAVASACAANALAVVVPCHRVVGSDGSLSGYRWGIERKRLLLDREKAA